VEIPKEGNEVSTASAATGSDSGSGTSSKKPIVIALAAIGAVALIVGILWFVGAAPGFLNVGSHVKHGSHLFRGGVAAIIGLGLLVFAWIQNKKA
jgi:uncharacterized OB-fold protein